jgi:hypothetical protein
MNPALFDRMTRHLGARATRRAAVSSGLAALALGRLEQATVAQDATPAPGATPDGEKPVFMFVETFASGRGDVNPGAGTPAAGGTPTPGGGAPFLLTLEGHTGLTVYFSDRPDRVVGAVPTGDFLDTLGFDAANPPNAALVGEFTAGQGVVVLQLLEPAYDPDTGTLTYGAEVLDAYKGGQLEPVTREQLTERLPAEFGPSALFIDDCPDLATCTVRKYNIEWEYYENVEVGPIPGGPYGQCWQGAFKGGCEPCHYSWAELEGFCNNAYPDQCHGECRARQ